MADTVDTKVIGQGRHYVVRWQNRSDGTGETGVNKLDISTLTSITGQVPTYTVFDRLEWAISGMTVRLDWNHTTDDEIATLSGTGSFDWSSVGGNADPKSAGDTGDVLLTTIGHAAGSTYDITAWIRLKP
jgi:hypothetical protein